jgi:hypothetical protein
MRMKHVFAKASDHFVEGTATSSETDAGAFLDPAPHGMGLFVNLRPTRRSIVSAPSARFGALPPTGPFRPYLGRGERFARLDGLRRIRGGRFPISASWNIPRKFFALAQRDGLVRLAHRGRDLRHVCARTGGHRGNVATLGCGKDFVGCPELLLCNPRFRRPASAPRPRR